MINFQTSVVKIPWLAAVPESLSPWQIWRLSICVLVVPMEPNGNIGIYCHDGQSTSSNVKPTGSPENVANTTGIFMLSTWCCSAVCPISRTFEELNHSGHQRLLQRPACKPDPNAQTPRGSKKKASSQKGCPFLSLFCVWWRVKSFASLLYSTNHLFAVYQFLAFCKLIITFL